MLYSCNTQCIVKFAECHIILYVLRHSPLILWSSEDHWRHWITVPKDTGSRMIGNGDTFLKHPNIKSQMAAIFIPYLLLKRPFFQCDWQACIIRSQRNLLPCLLLGWNSVFSVTHFVGIAFQFPVAHDKLDLKTLVMSACLACIQIDCWTT